MSLISYGAQDIMFLSDEMYEKEKQYLRDIALIRAVTLLSALWKMIKARRRKMRLLIKREIEHLPVVGIKYIEAMERFNININTNTIKCLVCH